MARLRHQDGVDPAEAAPSNAVLQCGKVIGYLVEDDEGRPLLVDERGAPVREDQAGRRPVPPALDEHGKPRWVL